MPPVLREGSVVTPRERKGGGGRLWGSKLPVGNLGGKEAPARVWTSQRSSAVVLTAGFLQGHYCEVVGTLRGDQVRDL